MNYSTNKESDNKKNKEKIKILDTMLDNNDEELDQLYSRMRRANEANNKSNNDNKSK
jgi:hypothetical protein